MLLVLMSICNLTNFFLLVVFRKETALVIMSYCFFLSSYLIIHHFDCTHNKKNTKMSSYALQWDYLDR